MRLTSALLSPDPEEGRLHQEEGRGADSQRGGGEEEGRGGGQEGGGEEEKGRGETAGG